MNNQIENVSLKTQGRIEMRTRKESLQEKIVNQLMVFNKCTYERALCMYKEMMQTIADYYLLENVSLKTRRHGSDVDLSMQEIEVFAKDVCKAYGIIEESVNQLTEKLC